MSDFFPTRVAPHRVRIEIPGSLNLESAYGFYLTNEAQEDKIVRVVVVDDVVVFKIHPDGTLDGNTKGWAVDLYEDPADQGMLYIWLCPLCGQPLPEGQRCNSGAHQGPADAEGSGPLAVRSIDLAQSIYQKGNKE